MMDAETTGRRSVAVKLYMTQELREKLYREAALCGMKPPDYIRACLRHRPLRELPQDTSPAALHAVRRAQGYLERGDTDPEAAEKAAQALQTAEELLLRHLLPKQEGEDPPCST